MYGEHENRKDRSGVGNGTSRVSMIIWETYLNPKYEFLILKRPVLFE